MEVLSNMSCDACRPWVYGVSGWYQASTKLPMLNHTGLCLINCRYGAIASLSDGLTTTSVRKVFYDGTRLCRPPPQAAGRDDKKTEPTW